MLQARPEVVDMDVSGDDIGVVLSMEAIRLSVMIVCLCRRTKHSLPFGM